MYLLFFYHQIVESSLTLIFATDWKTCCCVPISRKCLCMRLHIHIFQRSLIPMMMLRKYAKKKRVFRRHAFSFLFSFFPILRILLLWTLLCFVSNDDDPNAIFRVEEPLPLLYHCQQSQLLHCQQLIFCQQLPLSLYYQRMPPHHQQVLLCHHQLHDEQLRGQQVFFFLFFFPSRVDCHHMVKRRTIYFHRKRGKTRINRITIR